MNIHVRNIIIGAGAVAVLITGAAWMRQLAATESASQKEWSGAVLAAQESFYDFGTISMAAGTVRNVFVIRNDGAEPVTITKITTSCMCTKATLKSGGRSFGPFGMPGHGAVPGILQVITPGETAEIAAVFDPAAHGPSGTGKIRRVVSIETNSQIKPRLELSFAADVTP